jgi:hypothetical protein
MQVVKVARIKEIVLKIGQWVEVVDLGNHEVNKHGSIGDVLEREQKGCVRVFVDARDSQKHS